MKGVRDRLLAAVAAMRAAAKDDAAQFDRVMAAFKLPKATPPEVAARDAAILEATLAASRAPLDVMRAAAALFSDLKYVAEHGNPSAASDAAVGALMARTCVHGSAYNVLINVKALGDHKEAAPLRAACEEIRARVDRDAADVLKLVDAKL
jgi:glutamate formiminotransferase / formiminotetrahydrofolate cyclodeaminase